MVRHAASKRGAGEGVPEVGTFERQGGALAPQLPLQPLALALLGAEGRAVLSQLQRQQLREGGPTGHGGHAGASQGGPQAA